jgi:hypothetical protein
MTAAVNHAQPERWIGNIAAPLIVVLVEAGYPEQGGSSTMVRRLILCRCDSTPADLRKDDGKVGNSDQRVTTAQIKHLH